MGLEPQVDTKKGILKRENITAKAQIEEHMVEGRPRTEITVDLWAFQLL